MDPTLPALSALQTLLRRLAVVELARAAATYQPVSYDDAVTVIAAVVAALDIEIDAAGDGGDDASFAALTALRTAVVRDLSARGGDLSPLGQVVSAAPQPALTLAARLYADAARADQLVAIAAPRHPLFMPVSFLAPAA